MALQSRLVSYPLIAIVPFVVFAFANCASVKPTESNKSERKGKLVVVSSGDLNGYIAPCGCTKPMLGGLARRATLIEDANKANHVIAIENGDLTKASNRQDQIKAESIVDIFSELKYDAINLGEKEFQLGLPYIRSLQERFSGSVLCANVLENGTPIGAPFSIAERSVEGKTVRVAIIGVLAAQFSELVTGMNPGLEFKQPEEAIKSALDAIGTADSIVLLYHGSRDEAKTLQGQFPSIKAVIFAHEDDPREDGAANLICAGNRGRMLAITELDSNGNAASTQYPKLGPEYTESKKTAPLISAYLSRLSQEDLMGSVPRSPLEASESFAGSKACQSCHSSAHEVWKESKHSTALVTLKNDGHSEDPECVPCHVVGLDRKGGFQSEKLTPNLAGVGCESCHGPSGQHASNPVKFKTTLRGEDSCINCHIPDHSPAFKFDLYWNKIRH